MTENNSSNAAPSTHRTDETVAERSRFIESIVNLSPDMLYIYDLSARKNVYVNEGIQRILGYSTDEVQHMGDQLLGVLMHPDDLGTYLKEILPRYAQVKDDELIHHQYRMKHRNGQWSWLDCNERIYKREPDGSPGQILGVVHDITEPKRAEEKHQVIAQRILRQREVIARTAISPWVNEGHVVKAAAEITEAVAAEFGIERVSVWLFNESGAELVCVDLYEAIPQKHSVGAVLFEPQFRDEFQALKHARSMAAEEPLTDPRTAGYGETYLKPLGITSMLDGAIVAGGRFLGILCFEHVGRPHHWEHDEISFNNQLADQIGMAVLNRERRKAEEALQESETRYRELFEAESDAIVLVDNETGRILEANHAASVLYGYDRDVLLAKKNSDLSAEPEETLHVTQGMPVSAKEVVTIPLRFHRRKDGTVFPVEITGRFFMQQGRPVHIAAIRNITDRKQAEAQLQRSLREKEVMLKEIHHRVKNNMQVIYSLLNLQAKGIADTTIRAMFEDARNRVNSMALIHEKLYQSKDLAHINFNEYLQSLVAGIADTYKQRDVVISVDREPVALDVNVGIPCGLIVNELVSNSFKHAFPAGRKGTIRIGLNNSDGSYVLTVADNGIGFPDSVDFRNTPSLGLQLVTVLAGQIRGTIELLKVKGTTFSITFPRVNSIHN